jgi:short-subunit dehydrogenase
MRHYLPGMRLRGRGGLLNLASLGGYTPGPYQAAYYASKAYVISLTEAIAAETAGEGVRACALAPGPVDTAWHERAGAETALYRSLVPPASAASVARAGYLGYLLGLRVVVPGLLNPFLALALKLLPHRLMVPFIAWLLKPRTTRPH